MKAALEEDLKAGLMGDFARQNDARKKKNKPVSIRQVMRMKLRYSQFYLIQHHSPYIFYN